MYKLTDEGKKYLEQGLPEKRLADALAKGPISMAEAQKMEDFSVAMQWAKRNGWIEIRDGRLRLAMKPGKLELQDALASVAKTGEAGAFNLPIGMQWAKRNGWIEIRDGRLRLAMKPGKLELQDALASVAKTGEAGAFNL